MTPEQTLLDVFEPPNDRVVAHSSVLVAMSGTRDFLEDALIQFTGLKAKQRAEQGITNTYLVLDAKLSPERPRVFAPYELPGLLELQPRNVPVALLHAKLALLGFAPTRTSEQPTHVRLAVLTANLTYASARHQLELVWTVDLDLGKQSPANERADVAGAAAFVAELIARRYHLPERSQPKKNRPLTARLDTLLQTCAVLAPDRATSGFIHSLEDPLYQQIKSAMKRLRGSSTHNFLVCGSGFYEDPGTKPDKPKVLAEIEKLSGFTDNARRVVIVEPTMAGAIAPWVRANAVEGWKIFAPHDARLGDHGRRSLHAKYIYAGWLRDGFASNGCLYLGSGNLSQRGLFTAGSQATRKKAVGHGGVNIECGVVFAVDERLSSDELAERLFWHMDQETEQFDEWEPGTDPDEDESHEQIVASPILVARLANPDSLALEWREDISGETFALLVGDNWSDVTARQVSVAVPAGIRLDVLRVRDASAAHEWVVPIVDEIGRVCWTPPTFTSYDDALAALLDFPIRPVEDSGEDDEDKDPDDHEDDDRGCSKAAPTSDDTAKGYALHAAAELLERTAALQRSLETNLLDDWLDHIERFFHASFPPWLIKTWRTHRIDVFTHLAKPAFRPDVFTTKQRKRYEEILESVAGAWELR